MSQSFEAASFELVAIENLMVAIANYHIVYPLKRGVFFDPQAQHVCVKLKRNTRVKNT